ncbi:DUF1045 domain-containing protein [Paracoccus liaowanqingii]|uniref:DUF1045 domain-containing protein n=1 Tax=Paracoccus liaowanqingii TaxID=2560053 RepID=A0A4Z1BXE5_9RHOB|nr:DUF1045 domain-containing protein [Paracoccus liaowanqingii]TGN37804.1 DUF1045 domain-containing protein [Paracoccus liaowanqingii]
MQDFTRYAVYYAPQPGPFADAMAAWLGWDVAAGRAVAQPQLPDLPGEVAELTRSPRKYGFHGTIRAPFRPVVAEADLIAALDDLAAAQPPVRCEGLQIHDLHGFLALMPQGCDTALADLAEAVMRATDPLRAPLTQAEIARRRPESLTPRQRALLDRWGYPFVMEEFRFHLTLTDQLPPAQAQAVAQVLRAHLDPVLPRPFVINDLCLMAEDLEGRFHLRHRSTLSG